MSISTGGDVCEPYVIERLAANCQFHNLYGPTEATVLITAGQFQPGGSNRNLGRPIANSQLLILDEQMQPVAEHTPGELYIVGPGVGLGYIHNPALTDERYVRIALGDGESVRAYRTGDIGKWSKEGVELSGRRDNQVKIRGFRVEPEEIEHCLRDRQLYRQVAVVIDDQRRILAFLAQPHGVEPDVARHLLKAHIEQLLPDYMRPAAYTELATMPFANNGKIDRKALLQLPVKLTEQAPRRPRKVRMSESCRNCGPTCWSFHQGIFRPMKAFSTSAVTRFCCRKCCWAFASVSAAVFPSTASSKPPR